MNNNELLLSAIMGGFAIGTLCKLGLEEIRWHWWAWRWSRVGRKGLTRQDWKRERYL